MVAVKPMCYYIYYTPGCVLPGTLNTTEPPESVKARFKYGEYGLRRVTYHEYLQHLRRSFKGVA